jgi:hypothetical protein
MMDGTEEPIACSHAKVIASFSFCRLLPLDIFISSLLHPSLSLYLPELYFPPLLGCLI